MRLRAVLALSLLALAACATPLKTRYYTLSGESPPPQKAVSGGPEFRVAYVGHRRNALMQLCVAASCSLMSMPVVLKR